MPQRRDVCGQAVETILPDGADWERYSVLAQRQSRSAEMFDVNSSTMPEPETADSVLIPKPGPMHQKGWKAAGPESNQKGGRSSGLPWG